MSTKSTKTIDNLGIQSYIQFEENRQYHDDTFADTSRSIASQLTTDVFEPIIVTDYQLLFEVDTKGATWGLIPPPKKYHDQKGRLFTYQLAPKLGPFERIELQMTKIEDKKKSEEEMQNPDFPQISKEASTLKDMMQTIQVLNTIMEHITSERYRYCKG